MNAAMQAKGLRPVSELGAGRPHGDRLRYMAGCKCRACRRANSAYESQRAKLRRQGLGNGVVDAAPARAKLLELERKGVAIRSIATALDIRRERLRRIRNGEQTRCRAQLVRQILAIVPDQVRADGALISGAATWRMIRQLVDEGFSKNRIAREALGQPVLQLRRKRVTVRNAGLIRRLWARYMTPRGF